MKIRCISDRVLSYNSNIEVVKWANNMELEITIGKIYVVIAISKYHDAIFFYILSDESEEYPLAYPSHLFEIIDSKISIYWDTDLENIESVENLKINDSEIVSFKEWHLRGGDFYLNLLEENEKTVQIFKSYRDKMLLE